MTDAQLDEELDRARRRGRRRRRLPLPAQRAGACARSRRRSRTRARRAGASRHRRPSRTRRERTGTAGWRGRWRSGRRQPDGGPDPRSRAPGPRRRRRGADCRHRQGHRRSSSSASGSFGLLGNLAEGFLAGWTESATPVPTPAQLAASRRQPPGRSSPSRSRSATASSSRRRTSSTRCAALPCTEPHDGEVFFVEDHPGADYPSDDEFGAFVDAECRPAFEAFTGSDFDDQDVLDTRLVRARPEGSWDDGDHEVMCYLTPVDGTHDEPVVPRREPLIRPAPRPLPAARRPARTGAPAARTSASIAASIVGSSAGRT